MEPIDDKSHALGLPLPHPGNKLEVDVLRIRDALNMIDEGLANAADAQQVHEQIDALQELVNSVKASQITSINGKTGNTVVLRREDLKLGPANGASSTAITYDGSGRVSVVTETIDAKPAVSTLTYDDAGNVKTVETTYDGRKRTETLTYNNGRLERTAATEVAV